jgi:hypothetical protein
MRLGDRLGVDSETLSRTYYTCLLFYVGCTATVAFQRMLGDEEFVARVVRERAGGAFDPVIANRLADEAEEILALADDGSAWEERLACEPTPRLILESDSIDRGADGYGRFRRPRLPLLSRSLGGSGAAGDERGGAMRFRGHRCSDDSARSVRP